MVIQVQVAAVVELVLLAQAEVVILVEQVEMV